MCSWHKSLFSNCVFFFQLYSFLFFLSFLYFFFLDKIKAEMLKYPASLEKKSTGKIYSVSAGLLALLWLRKSHVLESSHGWGIYTVW